MSAEWEIELRRDGYWPTAWTWLAIRKPDYKIRSGTAITKDRARRKALAAKRSMEEDDVEVTFS